MSGDIYISGNKAYSDGYHPNADTVGGLHVLKGSASGTIATQTAYGSLYYSVDISISFGSTLPSVPTVTTGLYTNGIGFVKIKSISTTGFICNLVNAAASSSVGYVIYWIAIY